MDITKFLTARWDDQIESLGPDECVDDAIYAECPKYATDDIASKRRILTAHAPTTIGWGPDVIGCTTCDAVQEETWGPDVLRGAALYPCETVRLLALPFAVNADYDEAWRI